MANARIVYAMEMMNMMNMFGLRMPAIMTPQWLVFSYILCTCKSEQYILDDFI